MPTRQGFDFFYGYLDQVHAHNYYPAFLMRNEQRVPLRPPCWRTGNLRFGALEGGAQWRAAPSPCANWRPHSGLWACWRPVGTRSVLENIHRVVRPRGNPHHPVLLALFPADGRVSQDRWLGYGVPLR